MSRIGKKPITVPSGVKVSLQLPQVTVTGPKGTLNWSVPAGISIEQEAAPPQLLVRRADDKKQSKANHGLSRALISNMVVGVTEGYKKELHIYGTGFNCAVQGNRLQLNVGFSGRGHGKQSQFDVPIPEGLSVEILTPAARGANDPARFVVSGADKQQVGQFAAEVRKLRKPEPYLGKGIRYHDEVVKRKAGKAFAGGAT